MPDRIKVDQHHRLNQLTGKMEPIIGHVDFYWKVPDTYPAKRPEIRETEWPHIVGEVINNAKQNKMDSDQWEKFGRELERQHLNALIVSACRYNRPVEDTYYGLATLITELTWQDKAVAYFATITKEWDV